jgi:hypothetical protein
MKISSYEQYYVRKLMQRSAPQLSSFSGMGIQTYFQSDLNQVLKHLYPQLELIECLQELSRLIELHHKIDLSFRASQMASQIERKIFWLLGLELVTLPLITSISEASGVLFRFMLDNRLQEGLRHANHLYGKLLEFEANSSLQSHPHGLRLVEQLNAQRSKFVLTVSETRQGLWIDLRSSTYLAMLRQQALLVA